MSELPLDLYRPATLILVSLLSMALGIIGYFLRDIRATMAQQLSAHQEQIKEVKDDLMEFKATIPRTFVMREDFIRAVAGLDHKVDTIGREITEINKNIGKLLGGGTGGHSAK